MERKARPFEFKADSEGRIEGYASRFGEVDRGGDSIAKGAYANSLQRNPRVKMLWQHNASQPIGVWDELKEDDTGLMVKGRLIDATEKGREAIALIEAGALDGLSIGYRTIDAGRGDKGERILKEVELWEVSLVTFPMQESAVIDAMKAYSEFEHGNAHALKKELERYLREVGASNTEAKAGASAAVGKLADMREARSGLGELAQFMREFQTGLGE